MLKPSLSYLKSLEQRLAEAPNRRTPASLLEVELFLTTHPTLARELSVTFIRNITSTVCKSHNEVLVREAGARYGKQTWRIALDYCIEAINRIEHGPCTEQFMADPHEKAKMHGSLYTHAGNCALNIATRMTNEPNIRAKQNLLRQAIHFYNKSIDLAEEANKHRIAAYTFGYRADAYIELADTCYATDRINNFAAAAEDLIESGNRLKDIDVEHASRQYSFAARYNYLAAKLATKTPGRQIMLLRTAIEHAKLAQKYQNNADPHYNARLNYDIGKYADALFEITKKPEAAQLAIMYFKKAADHFMQHPGPKDHLQKNALSRIEELSRAI